MKIAQTQSNQSEHINENWICAEDSTLQGKISCEKAANPKDNHIRYPNIEKEFVAGIVAFTFPNGKHARNVDNL